ncbi:MAG: winged helix-turn-helix transcriptional regulator [Treponemataceae bacterium]|nr:winged helix-turn-helix transcriptional regulator [Treponemataceae bacterium]
MKKSYNYNKDDSLRNTSRQFLDGNVFRLIVPLNDNVPSASEMDEKTTQKSERNYPINEETTQKILEIIIQNPMVTREELAQICGITPDGIKWQLNQLKLKDIIRRVGSKKNGHWEIIKEE